MKKSIFISICFLAVGFLSYQWNEQRETIRYHEGIESGLFFSNIERIKVTFDSSSHTLNLYEENFSDKENLFFQEAIKKDRDNIVHVRNMLMHIENLYRDEEFVVFKKLEFFEKTLNSISSGEIKDEVTIRKIGEIINIYISEIDDILYNKKTHEVDFFSQETRERICKLFENMNQEIETLL